MSEYLQTSEHEEAVRSLEFAALQAQAITNDLYAWKWVLISLHNAAQGFMVLALWNGNGLLSMPDDVAMKWLKAYDNNEKFPKDRLDKFLNLYSKCKKSDNFNYCGSVAFQSTNSQDASFKDLNDFRNDFIHFNPKGWSLCLVGLPALVIDVLELIQFFGWNSTAILWHEIEYKERAIRAYESLSKAMTALKDTN